VIRFPECDQRQQASAAEGTSPIWSADGRELFYQDGNKVLAVPVETSATGLRLGRPQLLFEGHYRDATFTRGWAVHPDGKRFLMLEDDEDPEFRVVFNWFEELKRLVPVGR
jgi:hypothetical protein